MNGFDVRNVSVEFAQRKYGGWINRFYYDFAPGQEFVAS